MTLTAATGWLDPSQFAFLSYLEANSDRILRELRPAIALPAWSLWGADGYAPTFSKMKGEEIRQVLQANQTRIGGDRPGWKLFGFYLKGRAIDAGCRSCPETAKVLSQIPGLINAGFSCLEANYHLPPHVGHDPRFYRSHLGLVIPPGDCALRVGTETRTWQAGKAWIFDDTCRHEAWNRTPHPRFILIVDVDRQSCR